MWSKIFCIIDLVHNFRFCLGPGFLPFPRFSSFAPKPCVESYPPVEHSMMFKHLVHEFLLTFFCLFSFCFSCLSNSIKNIVSSKAFSFLTCGHGLLTRTLTMNGMWTFTNKMTGWPWRHLDPLHVEGGVVRGPVPGARPVVYLRMNEVRIYEFGVNNMPLPIMPN